LLPLFFGLAFLEGTVGVGVAASENRDSAVLTAKTLKPGTGKPGVIRIGVTPGVKTESNTELIPEPIVEPIIKKEMKPNEKVSDPAVGKSGNVFIPFVNYALETQIGYGLIDTAYFHIDESKRLSAVRTLLMGTQNNQYIFRVQPELFFNQDRFRLVADVAYYDYPDRFYGLGNASLSSNEELFTNRFFRFFVNLRKRVSGPFEVGVLYEFEHDRISFDPTLPILGSGRVLGSQGGVISGLGMIASMDTRNRIFFPEHGSFYQASLTFYEPWLGSDFTYERFRLDLRDYWSVFSDHVLSFQLLTQLIHGRPGMYQTSALGGDQIMRGYWSGRFRDLHMLASQLEYRLPIVGRLGMVGFAGLGSVSNEASGLITSGFKPSYGAGLRFAVDPVQKLNARFDYAWGENTSGFYFQLGESF
jgi:hypothetical protein